MSVRSLFESIEALESSTAIRESLNGYPILLTSHVVGMCLFLGLIIMMDLRLSGLGFRQTPFSELQRRLFPWQMLGLAITTLSGSLLFYGQPTRYLPKALFWLKMVLMVIAGINALYFHLTTYRSVAKWDRDVILPSGAKLAGVLSLVLWAGVVVFGRLTAYNWFTYE
ncbi:MAG: hypothetical protein ABW318_26960 [Vicinamibacterales bacterium]